MFVIRYTNTFLHEYKNLPNEIKDIAEDKISILKVNPFDVRLKTHKLDTKLKKYWSFSINYRYRIIFVFDGDKIILFHHTGTHDIYRKIV